ncbi:hypothetical protein [Jannaschia sp. 2305UL9-9]|uniref:hypothetical protein n=1 Tax=Jannaschia sp. 2305UL9-9 TaxID=3121638 RepID=UPI003527A2B4
MIAVLGKSLGDILGIVIALWFIFSADFADIPYKRILDAVALFVILLSAVRIIQRLRQRP